MPLSPLDGRYNSRVAELEPITSEFGLMRYRVQVEVLWLKQLEEIGLFETQNSDFWDTLHFLYTNFDHKSYEAIKKIEETTNHDVKAVEYFIRNYVPENLWAFIHWGCTSEDINNTSYALMLRDAKVILVYELEKAQDMLKKLTKEWKSVGMLSRTHGQSATPTTVGKEILVFVKRLERKIEQIKAQEILAKINGATGTFGAHSVAMPDVHWPELSQKFIEEKLELQHNPVTTQIEPHDAAAELMYSVSATCSIVIDLCRDFWGYISLGFFGQKKKEGEVGSSTMPHKVNPIDFENSEGNMKLTRGIATTLAEELPISRWQRDLTDSTLQRNYGLVFGHFVLGIKSLQKGLGKLELNGEKIENDLENNPEVLTEAIQTVMRREGDANAYEKLKDLSRGEKMTPESIKSFIEKLKINPQAKEKLLNLTPSKYRGLAEVLVEMYL